MRRLIVLATAAIAMVVSATPASAGPTAGCPPTFRLLTFEQILTEFPPPPDVDAEAQLAANDRNEDEMLCVEVLPEPAPGPGLLVIDNVVAT